MTRLVFTLLICTATGHLSGQELGMKSNWWSSYWTIDGERVKKRVLREYMKVRPEAWREQEKCEAAGGFGYALRTVGPIVVIAGGTENNWTGVGFGLGMFIGGMALIPVSKKHAERTIELFNNSTPIGQHERILAKPELVVTQNGFGIVLKF